MPSKGQSTIINVYIYDNSDRERKGGVPKMVTDIITSRTQGKIIIYIWQYFILI